MAESFVFNVAENVISKLCDLASQEIILAWGIRADLEKLESTLTTIKAVLLDAEEKQIEALRKQDRKESRIGEKRYIIGQGMTGASTGRPTPSCKHRRYTRACDSWNRRSGKTALAELVFNDICVHNHFELKLWVCVSEDFDLQLLVLKFVKAERGGDGDLGSKNLQQLQMALRDCLNGEEKQNPNLVEIGEEIVKKCNGVPLLLKTLGSMLFSKTAEREWELVKNSETWRLMEKDDEMVYVLKLSYDQLSPRLKQCFAYCLLFPKDYEFIEFGLISFWMAHGLLESSDENENPFDIGRQYLNELLSRSLFEDFNVAFLYGVFKMHHLLHDLALLVAKNECCLVNTFKEKIAPSIRHVRLINSDSSNESASDLVSLNLCDCRHMKKLPNSICELQNLLGLGFAGCDQIEELPKDMGKMTRIQNLTSLHTLGVASCKNLVSLPHGLNNLTALQTLVIGICEKLVLSEPHGFKEKEDDDHQGFSLQSLETTCLPKLENLPLHRSRTISHHLKKFRSSVCQSYHVCQKPCSASNDCVGTVGAPHGRSGNKTRRSHQRSKYEKLKSGGRDANTYSEFLEKQQGQQ
ncbi:hypothetical protein F3Y22_tig00016637pilonHSYRG00048 [Hibiscus syriacus]|uniref:NB-ARC domain-containing protein n=1 Tax=Hibiscus syriacus TaxID=106335 RepID=A0A6A3BX18_HIBSY|nr:hypothetical protein F3Y22_tig00016637pilonHSYRG00048 [Hibiscus syriacus]